MTGHSTKLHWRPQDTQIMYFPVIHNRIGHNKSFIDGKTLFCRELSNVAILLFLVAFLAHFKTLCYFLAFFCTILVFWAFYAILSQIRFVVIYGLFRVKLFWLKPCSCKKVVFFHLRNYPINCVG